MPSWVAYDEHGRVIESHPSEQPSSPYLVEVPEDRVPLWVDPRGLLAEHRYEVECGGTEFLTKRIQTDRESRSNWLGILMQAQMDPNYTVEWKAADGSFVLYNAQQAMGAAFAVSNHVKKCFKAENEALMAYQMDNSLTLSNLIGIFNTYMEQ